MAVVWPTGWDRARAELYLHFGEGGHHYDICPTSRTSSSPSSASEEEDPDARGSRPAASWHFGRPAALQVAGDVVAVHAAEEAPAQGEEAPVQQRRQRALWRAPILARKDDLSAPKRRLRKKTTGYGALPAWLRDTLSIGDRALHATHSLAWHRGITWCWRCGRWAHHVPKRLRHPCTGRRNWGGASAIKGIEQGPPPVAGME